MNCVRVLLGGFLFAALVGFSSAEKPADKPKANKDKIVGVWEFVKSSDPESAPPSGTTMEFAKDGKLKIVIKIDGKELPIPEGKYQVDGDTLTVTMAGPDGKEKPEKSKITKLTDTEFVLVDDSKGKQEVIELKKKK